jgi:hypothetical protein
MSDFWNPEQQHQNKWLDSQAADELRKWIRKNSCLCDMAGICNGCALADAEAAARKAQTEMEGLRDSVRELTDTVERQAEKLMRCEVCSELKPEKCIVLCEDCDPTSEEEETSSPMKGRSIPAGELARFLGGCDPAHDIWVTTHEDTEFDPYEMSLVTGYAYEDQDDEISREQGRKLNGQPFLRRPILRVEKNE